MIIFETHCSYEAAIIQIATNLKARLRRGESDLRGNEYEDVSNQ